jgi:hypothetical protein
MSTTDRVAAVVDLAAGETVLAAVRGTTKGMSLLAGICAGIGAAIGYAIATSGGDGGFLAAAIGGGVGAGCGVIVGMFAGSIVLKSHPVLGPTPAIAVTDRRVLGVRRALLTGRPTVLAADASKEHVSEIEVTPRKFFTKRVIVRFTDGTTWEIEVGVQEDPDALQAALGR